MTPDEQLSHALDADIQLTHERFVEVMHARLGDMELPTKERYFAVLSILVSKLETPDKTLRQVLKELMSEVAGLILAELGSQG